jgi:hypothetical protein
MRDVRWLHHWHTPDGELFSSCGITNGRFVLTFPGMVDFHISANQREVHCCAKPNVPEQTIRHLLIDQVIPRILGHWGSLVVHGSAVAVDGRAIVFVGESGLGKSTLATYFYQHGHPLLTDDCFEVRGVDADAITIVPNYSGARLFEDSAAQLTTSLPREQVAHYTSKQRVTLKSDEDIRDWPLGAIFCLKTGVDEPTPCIEITPIEGLKRIMRLVQCSFGLYAGTGDELTNHFLKQGGLSNSHVPYFELSYPRCYDQLSEVRECVLNALPKER